MSDQARGFAPEPGKRTRRALNWLDARTGWKSILKTLLDERIPGGARVAYVFGSGLLFIFLLQMITGVSLALYYTPTAQTAHTSVAYITKQVAGGAFLRSLHSYGSSAMIVVLVLHFLQTFLYGSFKGRRELLWLSGATLSFFVLGMGFTGYLLPWDQKAYFATAVGTNVAGQVPLIGNLVTKFLRGGDVIGTLTLSRFYVAHVFLIPATIFVFIGAHVFLFRKAGPAGPVHEDPVSPRLEAEAFYPRQVLMDMGFALLIMAALSALAYLRPVTLGPVADPSDSQFLPRPEWYYLPLFEWLKFWEGPAVVVGVVVVPALVAVSFFLLPFLDRGLERRPWRRPIPALGVSIVLLAGVVLGIKSQVDDRQGSVAAQLAKQHDDEVAYSKEPFEPYTDGSGTAVLTAASLNDDADPRIAAGKRIFIARGCGGCHGPSGAGTTVAPRLVGLRDRFTEEQLTALLKNPSARMRAARMPVVTDQEIAVLVPYVRVLGTPAAELSPSRLQQPVVEPAHPVVATPTRLVRIAAGQQSGADTSAAPSQIVVRGKQIFEDNGCFACHGAEGAGGGRAPALAPLISKVPDTELIQILQKPNSRMRNGGMPPVQKTPEELVALIAYLRTLPSPKGQSPAAVASPARSQDPVANGETPGQNAIMEIASEASKLQPTTQKASGSPEDAGKGLFRSQGCVGCHGPSAQGTQTAPSLVGISTRFPGDKLHYLLRHPTRKMQAGGMPTVSLDDADLSALVVYLTSLGSGPPAPPAASQTTTPSEPEAHLERAALVTRTLTVDRGSPAEKKSADALVARGRIVFRRNACGSCHGIDGLKGTSAAPPLAGAASLLPESALENMLLHHTSRMQAGGMPLTNFNLRDRKAIAVYIRSLAADSVESALRGHP